jgi:hypothetical protein
MAIGQGLRGGRRSGGGAPPLLPAPGPAGSLGPPQRRCPAPFVEFPPHQGALGDRPAHLSPELELAAAGVVARRSQTPAAVHRTGGDGAQMGQARPHSCRP